MEAVRGLQAVWRNGLLPDLVLRVAAFDSKIGNSVGLLRHDATSLWVDILLLRGLNIVVWRGNVGLRGHLRRWRGWLVVVHLASCLVYRPLLGWEVGSIMHLCSFHIAPFLQLYGLDLNPSIDSGVLLHGHCFRSEDAVDALVVVNDARMLDPGFGVGPGVNRADICNVAHASQNICIVSFIDLIFSVFYLSLVQL